MERNYEELKNKAWKFLEELEGSDDDSLVKSKERVAEHGEVFTPRWCVRDMMDLEGIMENSFDLDKTFLEPSCGTGNFLIQLIIRKLCVVDVVNSMDVDVIRAVASIYGVDIMPDNIKTSRERMLNAVKYLYSSNGVEMSDDISKSVQYILNRNIILGNTLTNEKITEDNSAISGAAKPVRTRSGLKGTKVSLGDTRVYAPDNTDMRVSEWCIEKDGTVVRKESLFRDCADDLCIEDVYEATTVYALHKQSDKSIEVSAALL